MRRKLIVVSSLLLFGSVQAAETAVAPDTIEARAQGCSTCHGAHGEGNKDPYFPRIAGKPAGYLFNQMQNFRDGQRSYPPMNYLLAYLHDDYLTEFANYFSSQSTDEQTPFAHEPALTSDGERLEALRFYRDAQGKLGMLQRRGHLRQAKRLHRRIRRRRLDACHQFSRRIVNTYQTIIVGDVSSLKLAKTPMAKSVLDSGWGLLKMQLQYKGQQAGRCVQIVNERDTTRTCSSCGARTGPTGLDMLAVRVWMCSGCGDTHDRDVNAAKNILLAGRSPPSVSGNEPPVSAAPPSQTSRRCEARTSALKTAA